MWREISGSGLRRGKQSPKSGAETQSPFMSEPLFLSPRPSPSHKVLPVAKEGSDILPEISKHAPKLHLGVRVARRQSLCHPHSHSRQFPIEIGPTTRLGGVCALYYPSG